MPPFIAFNCWLFALLLVVVFIHELGHFLMARAFGVRVDVLSLGFGPRFLQWRWGDTYWRITPMLFGGFTKLAGEHSYEAIGDPEEYLSKPRWVRLVIAGAGAGITALLAILIITGLFYFCHQKAAYLNRPADVGWVDAGSPAAEADVRIGDRISRIVGRRNPTWADVQQTVSESGSMSLSLSLSRGGRDLDRTLKPLGDEWFRDRSVGWHPVMPAKIHKIEPGSPADLAGLESGDQIISIDGVPTLYWPRIVDTLGDKVIELGFLRKASSMVVHLRPAHVTSATTRSLGVTFEHEVITKQRNIGDALVEALMVSRKSWLLISKALPDMTSRRIQTPVVSDPLFSEEPGDDVISEFLLLVSLISLNLAMLSLLPIPILDGGVIVTLLIEMSLGRDLSLNVKEVIPRVGFVLLMVAIAFKVYSDILKILPTR
jgi:regulator of sigma E protease